MQNLLGHTTTNGITRIKSGKNFGDLSAKQLRELKNKFTLSESQLQKQCVIWFRTAYPMFRTCLFAIPNGGKRNIITASRMKAEGQLAGVPDLFLAVPRESDPGKGFRGGLFIEMKAGRNKPSDMQRIMIEQLRMNLYEVEVCRTLEEFQAVVKKYLS